MLETLGEKLVETSAIAEGISSLNVDLSHTVGQEEDKEKIEWYKQRFLMFEEDGVLTAINPYLVKAQRDTEMNDYTRILILKEATEIMSHGGKHNG